MKLPKGAGEDRRYTIVIGCGRLGSYLARSLSDLGHDVCVIDRDGKNLDALGDGFNGQRIIGIEFDDDNLREGGIEGADALLAVSPDDNINITVSLAADKIYHVPKIIARVNDPNRQDVYKMLNIPTINPVQLGADLLISRVAAHNLNVVLAEEPDYDMIEVSVSKGKGGTVAAVESEFSCLISGIIHDGRITLPEKGDEVRRGDKILCTVLSRNRERLLRSLSKEDIIWNRS